MIITVRDVPFKFVEAAAGPLRSLADDGYAKADVVMRDGDLYISAVRQSCLRHITVTFSVTNDMKAPDVESLP